MEYLIRNRIDNDAYGITHVVTVSWNETYKGLVPDDFLENMKTNEDERARNLMEKFKTEDVKELVLEIDKEIVGFIRYGKSQDLEFANCGEIYAFYIINKYHGFGYGRKLFETAKQDLINMGFDKMIIACLKGNPTGDFYKHMGGKYIKDGLFERLNLKEDVFYYDLSEKND